MKNLIFLVFLLASSANFAESANGNPNGNGSNKTVLSGGISEDDLPIYQRITLNEFIGNYGDNDHDYWVKTNLNNKKMNLDCNGSMFLSIENSKGRKQNVTFDSVETCRIIANCVIYGGAVDLIINTRNFMVEEAQFSPQCHMFEPAPFEFSYNFELENQELDA